MKRSLRQRGLWGTLLVLAVFAEITAPVAHARARHSDSWAREHFATAERLREALNGRPAAERTRHDYQRVLDAYRNIYLGAPNSSKADPSVVAVAETLVEMGRHFEDEKIFNAAIDQYKFLRREYPGSKFRGDGLFTIGEIYKDDLNDPDAARASFEEFLHRYPRNRLADGARQAIGELDKQAQNEKAAELKKAQAEKKTGKDEEVTTNTQAGRFGSVKTESAQPRSGRLPRVTGIRHWSAPDYSRVAIDVDGEVKFASERIARPARIYFDLRDTKLASTLVGKSFDIDDGFLKKIRVAQYAPGRTRVVLEVDNLSEYDAFLLPNPYRIIIDIHGKSARPKERTDTDDTLSAKADVMAAPKTGLDGDSDANSTETKAAVSNLALPETGAAVRKDKDLVDEVRAPAPEPAAAGKKVQSAVVKRIVDVDDDDIPAANEVVKRKVPDLKKVVAKKPGGTDLDSDSDSFDAKNSRAGRGNADSRHRSTTGNTGRGTSSDLAIREASPTAAGDRSLIRALGLKIGKIVIDPGHGGHDTGTIGPNGLEEKDLVLEVGRRLGKLLETRLGAEVVYTRKDDTFIPLETRTAVANQARADLFVSIHANSSRDTAARGVETYYLNFTSSPEALEVAARENAVSEKSIYELQDLVKKIALKEKIEESREFAWDVQQSLHSGLALKSPAIRDRGVKKAPFIVLIGANMPSILAEISFVSNPTDEHRLATSEYRQRIAESLYRGIAKYVNGLSGVKVASKIDKGAGQ
jgi:N-acetylmuramoyl-L-alanine amidase